MPAGDRSPVAFRAALACRRDAARVGKPEADWLLLRREPESGSHATARSVKGINFCTCAY